MLIVPLSSLFLFVKTKKKKNQDYDEWTCPALPSLSSLTITTMNGLIKDFLPLPSELSDPAKRLRLDILILLM